MGHTVDALLVAYHRDSDEAAREQVLVELRFYEDMTQSQIAAEVGISQMHVSRLLRRALEIMRGRIEEITVSRSG